MEHKDDNKGKNQPSTYNTLREVRNGLIGAAILIIIGTLFTHFVLGIPFFP